MASIAYLDTHVVLWLFQGELPRISPAALSTIDQCDLRMSPIVGLEIRYLCEIGRCLRPPAEVIGHLRASIGLQTCGLAFESVIEEAERVEWTRDPFDRIIVGHAGPWSSFRPGFTSPPVC